MTKPINHVPYFIKLSRYVTDKVDWVDVDPSLEVIYGEGVTTTKHDIKINLTSIYRASKILASNADKVKSMLSKVDEISNMDRNLVIPQVYLLYLNRIMKSIDPNKQTIYDLHIQQLSRYINKPINPTDLISGIFSDPKLNDTINTYIKEINNKGLDNIIKDLTNTLSNIGLDKEIKSAINDPNVNQTIKNTVSNVLSYLDNNSSDNKDKSGEH
jgi:hypothetical protein